jgi:sucrose phosphorylase
MAGSAVLSERDMQGRLQELLVFIYGEKTGAETAKRLDRLMEQYAFLKKRPVAGERFSERDAVLITYGDQVQADGAAHLRTLQHFLNNHLQGVTNSVHILPFYPYTSDDGFSVVDYRAVDPNLGTWKDVEGLNPNFRLMFDAVVNHISASSAWFQGFLAGDEKYREYFLVTDPAQDLSKVTRPRTLPLLTAFQTPAGEKHVWTTFSADQIDLNFRNPDVLLDVTEALLDYVDKGASLIRLDAIGYLWKEPGTCCIHLPQTHAVVQVWRAVLDLLAPDTLLVTETNVPHKDNISYFGDGVNEAQMVYQFPLVPLVLNALQSGHARHLQEWAGTLAPVSGKTTFFNFLASHDGIGVVPARGILDEKEIQALVTTASAHGGRVSYKNNSDGTQSPYELNITFFDFLSDPKNAAESLDTQVSRFMASQAIMLSLQGVPGIYFHSLFGSPNWQEGLAQTGRARTINRQKMKLSDLEKALADPGSRAAKVFTRYAGLLRIRIAEKAFHPNATQKVIELHPALFSLVRVEEGGANLILAIINVSGEKQNLPLPERLSDITPSGNYKDLIGRKTWAPGSPVVIEPYQVLWLKARA